MKRSFLVFALVLFVVTPAMAEPAAAGDRQKLVQHLQRTSETFLKSVEGLCR